MQEDKQKKPIETGDIVKVLAGPRQGETGEVVSIGSRTRTHYIARVYTVHFMVGALVDGVREADQPGGGASEFYEEVIARDDAGKKMAKPVDLERVSEAKLAEWSIPLDKPNHAPPKALDLEKIPVAKPSEEKAPVKPMAIKPRPNPEEK